VDDLTRTVLGDVSHWKRQGVLPSQCPSCGCTEQEHCLCQSALPSLRDHASDTEAFDRAVRPAEATLRVLTTQPVDAVPAPSGPPCDGSYTCQCPTHQRERLTLVKRGGQGEGNASPFRVRAPRRAA
jgi:hypothetical protein